MAINNPMTGRPVNPHFTVPDIFGQAMSYADQIEMLIAWVSDTVHDMDFVTDAELSAAIEQLKQYSDAGDDTLVQRFTKEFTALWSAIEDAGEGGQLVWDMTVGAFRGAQDATRANAVMFDPWACTVEQLNGLQMTVSGLAACGLTCAGLAACGAHLTEPDIFPTVPVRYQYVSSI